MITIGNTIISDDIADKFFACDLGKCKGACCVEGDAGAPLNREEAALLEKIFPVIKPYMTGEGVEVVQSKGEYVIEPDGDLTTPTIENRECAYAFYDKGVLKCAIESAYFEGKTDFRKPISCHLYPIRITSYAQYDALNYERWDICNPACRNGEKNQIPLYKFLKEPLVRKYGQEWYNELVERIEK